MTGSGTVDTEITTPEIVIFGQLTLDNVITASGELLPQSCGGNAVYAALGARVWSPKVGVVSCYGDDYPRDGYDILRQQGIDTEGVRVRQKPHGLNVALAYRPDGSRMRRFPPSLVERIPSADRERFIDCTILPDRLARELDFSPDSRDVPASWWNSIFGVHCAMMPFEIHREIAAACRRRMGNGIWVQVDAPWFAAPDRARDRAAPLLADIDVFLPSEVDLDDFDAAAPADAVIGSVLELGAKSVVLKRGSDGCRIYRQGEGLIGDVPAVRVTAEDPTGAGDAFCGGFLAGMQITRDILAAARFGNVAASFAVEKPGLGRLLDVKREEAAARLKSIGG